LHLFQDHCAARLFCETKAGRHVVAPVAEKEMLKYMEAFRKSPRFSLISPLCQLREKSCLPVFTKCGELW